MKVGDEEGDMLNGGKEDDCGEGIGNLKKEAMLVSCKREDGEVVGHVGHEHLKASILIRYEKLEIVSLVR
jgi:hypothetical protein